MKVDFDQLGAVSSSGRRPERVRDDGGLGTSVGSLALPKVDAEAQRAINVWLARQPSGGSPLWSARIGDRDMEIMSAFPDHDANARLGLSTSWRVNGRVLNLALDSLGAIDPLLIGEPFTLLPEPMRNLVVQRYAVDFFRFLPMELRQAAELLKIEWTVPQLVAEHSTVWLALRCRETSVQSMLRLSMRPEDLHWLATYLPRPMNVKIDDIRQELGLSLRMYIGSTTLPLSDIDHLAVGDVVVLDRCQHNRDGVMVFYRTGEVGEEAGWKSAICKGRRLAFHTQQPQQLLMPPFPTPGVTRDRCPISELSFKESAMNAVVSNVSNDLELDVSFDMGDLPMQIGELRQLQEGTVIELPQSVHDATIYLRVGGQLIATGQLIAVGRKLGVRLGKVNIATKQ